MVEEGVCLLVEGGKNDKFVLKELFFMWKIKFTCVVI